MSLVRSSYQGALLEFPQIHISNRGHSPLQSPDVVHTPIGHMTGAIQYLLEIADRAELGTSAAGKVLVRSDALEASRGTAE